MLIKIVEVAKCRNKAYGNFLLRGRNYALITISKKLNTTVAEYGLTVLHELLHLWVTFLRTKGFRVSNIKEHKFIEAVEDAIFAKMRLHLKRKGGAK